jgi:hypothetical protein
MPGPGEEQRRQAEFDPENPESFGEKLNEAVSSKRISEPEKLTPSHTRARRVRSGRSGSDSNASRRTTGG